MKPLLNIRSVPITIEHKTTRAALRHQTTQPAVTVSRQRGVRDMQTTPAKVNIDSYETRASMGLKTAPRTIQESADAGKQAALDATREQVDKGNYIMDTHGRGDPIPDYAMSQSVKVPDMLLTYMPSEKPQLSIEGGTISFNYTMDKLTFDWNTSSKPFLEFVPPSIEFNVTQYNEVVIEYVGDPIYVPPSANPNYVPPPHVDVTA
jgi:hypothetical protein